MPTSSGTNPLIVNNRSCTPVMVSGKVKPALTQSTWRDTLDIPSSTDIDVIRRHCVGKGFCWDDATASAASPQDSYMACYKSSTPWSVDISATTASPDLSPLVCSVTKDIEAHATVLREYLRTIRTVSALVFRRLSTLGTGDPFFVKKIAFSPNLDPTFLPVGEEAAMGFDVKNNLSELQEYIFTLRSREKRGGSPATSADYSESEKILLNTFCYYLIKEFPPVYALAQLATAFTDGIHFFKEISATQKKGKFMKFLQEMELPGDNRLYDEVIVSYLDSISNTICFGDNGLICFPSSPEETDDSLFFTKCIVPDWSVIRNMTKILDSKEKFQCPFCDKEEGKGEFVASALFLTLADLNEHILNYHSGKDEIKKEDDPILNDSRAYLTYDEDEYFSAIAGSPKPNFWTLAQFLPLGVLGSRATTNPTEKYFTYLLAIVYAWGHEAAHHTFVASYYQLIPAADQSPERQEKDILRQEKLLNELKTTDPKYAEKRASRVKSIAEMRSKVVRGRRERTRLESIITDLLSTISIHYAEEKNPHQSISKEVFEVEGIPDVFSMLVLEYLIKTYVEESKITEPLAATCLRLFYNFLCPSMGGRVLPSHPAGVIRANFLKINKYLYDLVSPGARGGRRHLTLKEKKNKTKKRQYGARRATRNRRR